MLSREQVDKESVAVGNAVAAMTPDQQKRYYAEFEKEIRDPDTYAALNYFFIAGLHHFYCQKWGRGLINLFALLILLPLVFTDLAGPAIIAIAALYLIECWELVRSGIIIDDENNRRSRAIIEAITQ